MNSVCKIILFFIFISQIEISSGSSYNSYDVAADGAGTVEKLQETLDDNNNTIVAQYSLPISRNLPPNPLFYGWFYSFEVSDSLRLISEKYLANSYDYVPEFATFLDKAMYETNITDPFAYYVKPADPETGRVDPYYHTTAKFCGRKDCTDYGVKVGKHLGKVFQMHLVGLFFTPRTYGIRVKLTQEEQDIFEVDERKNSFQAVQPSEIHTKSEELQKNNSIMDMGHEYEGYFHSGTVSNNPLYPGIRFEPQRKDFHPTESRAHITLGCAPGVEAEQTGFDLVEIIDLEISGHIYHQEFSIGGGDIPSATLKQFGGDGEGHELIFVIYPTEKMVTDATFSVYL